nr:trichohyalin-like isoform X4 [Drosophila suzukii]
MDLRSWRKVLIQWVIECRFIEHNFITLEQSDLDAFFSIYVQKAQVAPVEDENALPAQPGERRSPLLNFLRDHYPEFSAHIDGRGQLVTSDYAYVYTLLLHYSCVKQPSVFIHSICKKLPELVQTCIANFFGQTLEQQLTRQFLRQSMNNVAVVYRQGVQISPSRPSCSTMSPELTIDTTPGTSSSTSSSPQPPSSTPQIRHRDRQRLQMSANEMLAPPTPRTELLEQRTRELRGVRAQLEVVSYEKTMLEEQQAEKEDLIKSLNKENMMAKSQLAKLKNAVQNGENADDSATDNVPNEFDHLKRSLLKEISQKEAIIAETNDKLQDLRAEKSELVEQLEQRLEESSLKRDKQELDRCLQEAREELHNRREVLNASSDLLNCSLSPNTTPENLGSSVVDKQLREKEHENAELREELQKQSTILLELSESVACFVEKHSIEPDPLADEKSPSVLSSISMIEMTFAAELAKNARLQKQCDSQTEHIADLHSRFQWSVESLDKQRVQLDEARARIDELEQEVAEANRSHAKHIRQMQEDHDHDTNVYHLENKRLIKLNDTLNEMVAKGDAHLAEIKEQLGEKERQIDDLGAQILDLRERNEWLGTKITLIDEERSSEASRSEKELRCHTYLRDKYNHCRSQLKDRIEDMDKLSRQLDASNWENACQRVLQLQSECESLKVTMESLNVYIKTRADKEQRLTSQRDELNIQNDFLNQQYGKLKEDSDYFLGRISSLLRADNSVNSLTSSIDSTTDEIGKRFRDIESLLEQHMKSFDETEARVNSLNDELADLQRRNAELTNENETLIAQKVQELGQLGEDIEKRNDVIKKQNDEIASLTKKIPLLEKAVKKTQDKLAKAHVLVQSLSTAAINSIATIEPRLLKLGSISTCAGCTDAKDPAQFQSWMTQFVDIYDQMDASRQTLENRCVEASRKMDTLSQAKKRLEEQVQQLQNKSTNDQIPMLKQLNETINNLEMVNDKLTKDNLKLHDMNLELSESLMKSHKEVERRATKYVQLEAADRRKSSDLHDCRKKQDEQKAELKSMQEKMAALKETYEKQIEELKANCDQRSKEVEKEVDGSQDLQINLKESEDKVSKLVEEHKQLLKNTKDEHEKRCKELEKQLAEKDEEQSKLKALEEECQKRCQDIEKQLSEKESQSSELVKEHEEEVKTIKAELEEARYQEKELRLKDKELRETIQTHKQLLREATSDLQDSRLQEQSMRQTMETHKQLMMESGPSEELLILRNKLQEEEKLTKELRAKLEKQGSSEELLSLRNKLQEEEKRTNEFRAKVEKLESSEELLSLRNKLQEEEKLTHELRAKVENRESSEELLSLRNKLQAEEKLTNELREQLEHRESSGELLSLRNKLQAEEKLTNELREQLEHRESSGELLSLRNKLQAEEKLTNELRAQLENRESSEELLSLRNKLHEEEKLTNQLRAELQGSRPSEELLNLRNKLQEDEKLTNELRAQLENRESSEELLSLRNKLQEEEKLTNQLRAQLEERGSSEELLSLRNKLQEEEKLTNQLKAQLEKRGSNKELVSLRNKLQDEEKLTKQLRTMLEKRESSKELVSLRNKLQEEEKVTKQLRLKLEKQRKELSKAKADLEDLKSADKNLHSLQTKLKDEEKLTHQLKEELSSAKDQLGGDASSTTELRKLYDNSKEELICLTNKLENEVKLMDQMKMLLDKQHKDLVQAKEQLKSAESSKEELLALQTKLQHEQKLTDQLKEELSKAKAELASNANRTTELNKLYQSSKQELLSLQTKLHDEQKLTDHLRDQLKDELDKLCGSSKEDLLSLQTQLQNEEKIRNLLKKKLFEKEEELKTTKSQLESNANRTAQVNGSSKEEMLGLRNKLQDQENLSHQLNAELAKQQELLSTANAQLESYAELEALFDGSKDEVARLWNIIHKEEKLSEQLRAEMKDQADAHQKEVDSLKLARDSILPEIQVVKGRMVKAEREYQVSLATLEDQIETLDERNKQAEVECLSAKERIKELESSCKAKEDQLLQAELLNDRLALEISCHKGEVEILNQQLAKKDEEMAELRNFAERIQKLGKQDMDELQQRLDSEMVKRQKAEDQLAAASERLTDLVQELDGTRLVHDACQYELEEKTREIETLRAESTDRIRSYKERLEALSQQLAQCNDDLAELRSANESRSQSPKDLGATYSKADAPEADSNLGQLRQEAVRNSKLALDCQILQAKYRDAKDEIQRCEQKIKDQRLEMEGKLDKMKTKMRSLYTAEVTRMKEKQERDAAKSASEMEALTVQNAKYEEHTRKLSNQIVRLNEKILEQQKQHAIISTKLRHLQMQPVCEAKPTTATITVSSSSSTAATEDWQPFKRPNAPSSNLAMEDEEGEVFNNTYLTDLKLGRVPTDMTAEELIYRNSLQPPHLKSTYAAQYDLGSQDEDLKDGPHSLDDSMSALLSSSSTGTRKKSMGTHYKRPGPPTPSKNGGRLSFGSSEPPREILREFGDHHNNTSKTPARFKFLTQRFSVGSSGLPRDELPHRKRPNLLTGIQRRRLRQAVGLFCTSTPRKSRSYYDQQRLIRVSDADTSEAQVEVEEEEMVMEAEEEHLEDQAEQQGTPHLSTAALLALTKGNTRRLTGQMKQRKGRVSLCIHGNIFAKSRTAAALKVSHQAVSGKRVQLRRKLRQERLGRFDQARHLDQVSFAKSPDSADNNNYSLHNRNEEQQQQQQFLMGKTVVLGGKRPRSPVVSTTFNVEQHSETWQLQQQFESENLATWAMENDQSALDETQEVWQFEQLCQETESTAPFQLQPLNYEPLVEPAPAELKLPQLVSSCSNITDASCATNMTSTSSRRSTCTVYSMGSVHMQPLPQINITYVQPSGSQLGRSMHNRSLPAQCRRILCRLSLGERVIVGLALLAIVGLCCLQLENRTVLVLTAVLAAMGLVLLTVSFAGRH